MTLRHEPREIRSFASWSVRRLAFWAVRHGYLHAIKARRCLAVGPRGVRRVLWAAALPCRLRRRVLRDRGQLLKVEAIYRDGVLVEGREKLQTFGSVGYSRADLQRILPHKICE